jgi:hypothetical protein
MLLEVALFILTIFPGVLWQLEAGDEQTFTWDSLSKSYMLAQAII